MAYHRLDSTQWKQYFQHLTHRLQASLATVRIDSLAIGDQVDVDHAILTGLDYDPKDQSIDLTFDDLDHRISGIGEVWVDEHDDRMHAICVTRTDGTLEVVEFEPVLQLTG